MEHAVQFFDVCFLCFVYVPSMLVLVLMHIGYSCLMSITVKIYSLIFCVRPATVLGCRVVEGATVRRRLEGS